MENRQPLQVFISYRRRDTEYQAAFLFKILTESPHIKNIFLDINSIVPGEEFGAAIDRAVGSCDVLLVIIGDRWLTITDSDGKRRLDLPADYVRIEIEAALRRNIVIVPVLIGTEMPSREMLPPALAALTRYQAVTLDPRQFDADVRHLIDAFIELHRKRSQDLLPPGTAAMGLTKATEKALLEKRIVAIRGRIGEGVVQRACGQFLTLMAADPRLDISLYIDSEGGSVTAGVAVFDTMNFIDCDVATYVAGQAAGIAQVLASAGSPGKRFAAQDSRIILRSPWSVKGLPYDDVDLRQLDLLHRSEMAAIIAQQTGRSQKQIQADWGFGYAFNANDARKYGFIDKVVKRADIHLVGLVT